MPPFDPPFDPIASWRSAQPSVVKDPPQEPISSIEDLRGTVFDTDQDPIQRWRREAIPKGDIGPIGRGIQSGMDFALKPIRAVAEPLEENARYLTGSIPPEESTVSRASPLSLLKAYGAGINKTLAGMASPAGAASFLPVVGPAGRALLASQQIPEGVSETAAGIRARSPRQIAGGVANTALGAALVGGDIYGGARDILNESRVRTVQGVPVDEGGQLALPPGEPRGLPPGEPRALPARPRLALPPGPDDTGGGGGPLDALEAEFSEAPGPRQLPPGRPTRFAGGAGGVVDVPRDYPNDPIAAWREANAPRGPRALLPERAGDIAAGVPSRPPMPLDQYLESANLRPGDPLAELEAQLYPQQMPGPRPTQLGLSDLTRPPDEPPEVPGAVQPVPPDVPPGPLAPAGAAAPATFSGERGAARGAAANIGAVKNRALMPEEEAGIQQLERLLTSLYGEDAPTRGNGLYVDPATGGVRPVPGPEAPLPPAAPGAAPAGEVPPGRNPELPAPAPSGMVDVGGGPRRTPGRRTPQSTESNALDELIADARQQGYQGDEAPLRNELTELLKMDDEINGEYMAGGRNPENLLRRIQQLGGLAEGPRASGPNLLGTSLEGDPYAGELRWLKEFGKTGPFGEMNYIQKVFRKPGEMKAGSRATGKTISQMAEALSQEPGFEHIQSADDLINELQRAATADFPGRDPFGRLERMGVKYGEPWWKKVGQEQPGAAEFNPQEFEDMLSTGEAQPRLPEAGQVRNVENKTPEFEAPFSLSAEADRTPRELEQALFGRDVGELPRERPGEPGPAEGGPGRGPDETPAPGTVRLYRVEPASGAPATEDLARGRWFSDDRHMAQMKYDRTAGPGVVKYIDVPEAELEQYRTAARQAGASQKADGMTRFLLPSGEANRAGTFSELPASETPSALGGVPSNVRDYLVKQLGYTPEEVAAMEPRQARRIGREQTAHPEREARRAGPPPSAVTPLPEGPGLPGERAAESFDQTRQARGLQRREALQRTAVPPSEPQAVEGAPPPKTPAERYGAGEKLTAKERAALELPEEAAPPSARPSLREQGTSPRQIQKRVQRMDSWMSDPTPENFKRWVDEVTGQAERINERQLKGGTGEEGKMPPKSDSGEYLAGSPFPGFQLLADPRLLKRAAQFLVSNEPIDRLLRGAIAGGVGAMTDEDHRLRGAVYGAIAGMMGPEIARAWASDFVALAKGKVPTIPGRGLPRVYEPRAKGDIGIIENIFGSKAHTIPEQFQTVRPAIDALQAIRETGKLDSRLPLLTNERLGDAGASAYKGGKLQVRQGEFLKPEIKYLRDQALEQRGKGRNRLGSYLEAYADELAGAMTRSEKFMRDSGVPAKLVNRLSTEGANQIYRQGLALNVGSAAVNRVSQPLLTAPYVGLRNLWKNYTPLSDAEKGLSDITRPVDQMEMARTGWKFLQKFDDIASSLMRFTDNHNRQGAYASAHLAAEQAGATPQQAYQFARDVSEKTQGLYGLLSGNPRWRGPLIKTLKPFTKYPILFAEWLNDAATSVDPRVRWRTAAMGAGVWAFSQATGVDLWDLISGGARYGGSGLLRGAMDVYAHATNQAKDHQLLAMPGKGFTDSDIGNIAYPVGVRKLVDTAQRFKTFGTEPHKTRTPGGALETVTPTEDLLNMFGVRTTRQTSRQQMLDDAHAHELAAAETDSQENAQARRDLLHALDMNDAAGAQDAVSRMSPNTAKAVFKSQNRDRYERLLHATPVKRRPELRDAYGELEQELRGPQQPRP